MNTAEVIAFTSLGITLISVAWNIFFGYAKMTTKIDVILNDLNWIKQTIFRMEERFDRIDARFEKMENKFDNLHKDLHRMDIRVNTLEQRKS